MGELATRFGPPLLVTVLLAFATTAVSAALELHTIWVAAPGAALAGIFAVEWENRWRSRP